MNEYLKNPIVLFIAGVLAIWLVFKVLSIFVNLFWLILLVFVVMFIVNPRFRNILRGFFNMIFKK